MMFSVAVRRVAPATRVGFRAISTTPRAQKTVTEKVKDTVQDVSDFL
jgi:hypothetical protein